jgi:uncharacterized protein YbjT (DUF2867 family)
MAPPVILVVGASGYFGSKIVQAFGKHKANVVLKGLSRKPRSTPDGGSPLSWVVGDMLRPVTLDNALAGVDIVVSSANG